MLKKVFGRKLSRGGGARKALFRSLVKALILHGKIDTTKAKAKAVQPNVDKLFTMLKKKTIASQKMAISMLGNDKEIVRMVIEKYMPAVTERNSGYTRIISLPRRKGDLAQMARIEFVDKAIEKKVEKKAEKKEEKKKTK